MESKCDYSFRDALSELVDTFMCLVSDYTRTGFSDDMDTEKTSTSGFPVFRLADPLYYESRFQEGILEWLVRTNLVNPSLNFLFQKYNYDIRFFKGMNYYRNREHEAIYPIEFILVQDMDIIAFRYTAFDRDYTIDFNRQPSIDTHRLELFFNVDHVDKWISIDWNDKPKNAQSSCRQHNSRSQSLGTVSIKQLFEEYFSIDEFNIFQKEIKEAVSNANQMFGFKTISKLNPSNLGQFKEKIKSEISSLNLSSLEYIKVNAHGELLQNGKNGHITSSDLSTIEYNFKSQLRYYALLGKQDFASSFFTSEYFFQIFQGDLSSIDYTSVVSGYVKSVEQLCGLIIKDFIAPRFNENIIILANKKLCPDEKKRLGCITIKRHDYIPMKKENQKYFKTSLTMGEMIYFFEYNMKHVFCIDEKKSVPFILECLGNYTSFDRNGFFHKDNIYSFDVVKRIRNNTLLLLYWLLGSLILSGDTAADHSSLGIVDPIFDQVYKNVAFKNQFRFIITGNDGVERKMIRLPDRPHYSYDNYGYIEEAKIQFIEVSSFPVTYEEYFNMTTAISSNTEIFTIDKHCLPRKMIMVDNDGNRINLLS